MKTWKLTVNEEELKALISHHNYNMMDRQKFDVETSARIHDLTKRLNRDSGEVELSNDPRTEQQNNETQQQAANTIGAVANQEWK